MFGHDDNTPQQPTDGGAMLPDAGAPAMDQPQPAGPPPPPTPNLIEPAQHPAPAEPAPAPAMPPMPAPAPTMPTPAPAMPPAGSDDLLGIKQQALQQLTPLVSHLDQSPEEKFRTTMMMIQASDNDALIKVAYEAAQSITDEKTRAQALLDIVNEINYFTQSNQAPAPDEPAA